MSKYLCADCVYREQCDGEWTMRCSRYVSVEHKQTNEQWFCSLSTEEKAKCLTNISFSTGYDSYNVVLKKMGEWLKQPHTNEVEK